LQLSLREKPKVVRSLQQCAPLWPIGELNFFFCLTLDTLPMLVSCKLCFILDLKQDHLCEHGVLFDLACLFSWALASQWKGLTTALMFADPSGMGITKA
jgi:hypothetical protein